MTPGKKTFVKLSYIEFHEDLLKGSVAVCTKRDGRLDRKI
jgi:hypothetical protein